MNTLSPPPPLLSLKPSHLLLLLKPPNSASIQNPNQVNSYSLLRNSFFLQRKRRNNRDFKCRAEFAQDAPFAVAIGASVLNSLVFPLPKAKDDDDDGESGIDSTDARFAVMGIISFVPYFNWLSWIFAWLDTGNPRYVVYSALYLAPYIRANLSLSPEESWLPIASIIFCIIHIQLEASIRNGDLQAFQLFKKSDANLKGRKRESEELPCTQEHSGSDLHGWGIPEKPLDQELEENKDANE